MIERTLLYPRQPAPELSVSVVGGGRWDLSAQAPDAFTLVVFYRGFHCPICSTYLAELARTLDDFSKLGVEVIAISSDSAHRAERAAEAWSLKGLKLGYGLSLQTAREWGLYISRSRGKTSAGVVEPELFSEPGLFLIRPDGTLYFIAVQSMPFARPRFSDLLSATRWVLENGYPARGEVRSPA